MKKYTKEYLIGEIYRFIKENNRIPKINDMCRPNGYPSRDTFQRTFGSWSNLLIEMNLPLNQQYNRHNGDETCFVCGNNTKHQWHYNNSKLVCHSCAGSFYRRNNPDRELAHLHRRRGYGFNPINKRFKNAHAHHLWLETTTDFVIFIPKFLHELHWHDHKNETTMITPNAIALDFWINEELYINLFEVNYD